MLVEWQKRIKEEEEERRRRQLEKEKAGQRALAQELREQREVQQRRAALDEEHFKAIQDMDLQVGGRSGAGRAASLLPPALRVSLAVPTIPGEYRGCRPRGCKPGWVLQLVD